KFLQPASSDEEDFSLANPPAVTVFNESDGNSPLPAFPSASVNTQVPLHLNDDGSQIQFVAANDGNLIQFIAPEVNQILYTQSATFDVQQLILTKLEFLS
ncbi:unnamed protein product, partial [Allacma fusca]